MAPSPDSDADASVAPRLESLEQARIYTSIRARLFGEGEALRIGAHRVVRKLGGGGMGEVFLAHDDQLDRPLAIKLVHPKLSHDVRFAERMRREARALAKLAHANVVHVYEVGEHEGRCFLAMEYVEGRSLGAWIREASPTWRAVLDAYLAAGEGLVAAHAAGLTHRDFKPDNVLRGSDGRICVADFGLVRASEAASEPGFAQTDTTYAGASEPATLDERLSASGAVMGTFVYMPLEQLRGGPVDARADQFAFCVALYEGLWGARPFVEASKSAREQALLEDRPIVPPRGSVPRWVWPIVRRGLARDPAQRWPDMRSLLDRLRDAPAHRRRRTSMLAASLVLPAALVGGFVALRSDAEDPCAAQAHALDEVWSAERRAAIEAGFAEGELSWGADNGRRVIAQLDRWARRWTDARVHVCRAERAEPTSPLLARQRECLERRRDELDELLAILVRGDAATQARAQSSVHGLVDPLTCEQIALAGVGLDAPPSEHADEVTRLRRELAELEALSLSGRASEALALADELLGRAQATGYAPVEAEVRFARARALLERGSLTTSQAELERAVDLAEASRHAYLAIEIWRTLAQKIAPLLHDVDGGERWLRRMRAAVRASEREDELAGALALVEGQLELARGAPEQATAPLQRAIERFEAEGLRVELITARFVLARALEQQGRFDDALVQYREARADAELVYGPDHPKVADRTYDLGIALHEQGRADEARVELERALAIWASVPELSGSRVVDGHMVLAMFDFQADRLDQAEAHARAAETEARRQLDDNPLALAQVAAGLGAIAHRRGDYERAMQALDQAALAFEAALGPSDPTVLQTRLGYGWAALLAGHPSDAQRAFTTVRERSRGFEAEPSSDVGLRLGLAITSLLAGAPEAAASELAALPRELEPFFALERELVQVFAATPVDEAARERLREAVRTFEGSDQRELAAVLELVDGRARSTD